MGHWEMQRGRTQGFLTNQSECSVGQYTWQLSKSEGALSVTRQVDVQNVAKLSKVLRKLALKQT